MREIDIDLLRQLLRYEPETGKLFWLERTPDMFEGNWNKTAEQLCEWWNGRFAGKQALNARGVYGCRTGRLLGKTIYAHRVAWALHYGEWPPQELDHINGDRADNRITNLRKVTHAENGKNIRRSAINTSGVTGVSLHKRTGRWQAYITVDGKRRHLGTFSAKSAAIAARSAAQDSAGFHSNHGRGG